MSCYDPFLCHLNFWGLFYPKLHSVFQHQVWSQLVYHLECPEYGNANGCLSHHSAPISIKWQETCWAYPWSTKTITIQPAQTLPLSESQNYFVHCLSGRAFLNDFRTFWTTVNCDNLITSHSTIQKQWDCLKSLLTRAQIWIMKVLQSFLLSYDFKQYLKFCSNLGPNHMSITIGICKLIRVLKTFLRLVWRTLSGAWTISWGITTM